jgi:hypothetical protein
MHRYLSAAAIGRTAFALAYLLPLAGAGQPGRTALVAAACPGDRLRRTGADPCLAAAGETPRGDAGTVRSVA